VFPSYFQPIEHHLSLVTGTPGLQYMFTGKTLIAAYSEILQERGAEASWYGRESVLADWERGNTINGMTERRFERLLADQVGGLSCIRNFRLVLSDVAPQVVRGSCLPGRSVP
jgi:hypothetical protein